MILLYYLALLPLAVLGVKHEDFKTCSQSSFCRRLRSIGTRQSEAPQTFTSPYSLGEPVVDEDGGASWTWPLRSSMYPEINFQLQVDVLREGDGIVRVRADEVGSSTPWKRYNETAKWVLLDTEPSLSSIATAKLSSAKGTDTISYGHGLSIKIERSPFKLTQLRNGKPEIVLNDRSLFHMEHFRMKEAEKKEEYLSEGEQVVLKGGEMDRSWFEEHDKDMFEERFRTWTDSKPKGPEALSIDLTFPGVQHIYGLPEHASPLSLPDTTGDNARYTDPYRLFNVDIFEYLADSPMSLYGAIPLLHAHSKSHSVGVLNLVGSETWVDVRHDAKQGVKTHWMSESGILDLLLLPGPKPEQLFEQYAILTGPTPLPPQWSTAYHQCRWNYVDEADVLEVDAKFDEHDIPLDVTWLDVEYTTERRYFDWNKNLFPDPVGMLEAVGRKFRKMVAIVDPHVKRTDDYRIYTDARDLDVLVKRADGSNFEGWCWPGSSVYVDFFNPKSWDWWTRMFKLSTWTDSATNLYIWNDMNEPSVFDGPEITVPKDTLHHGGWENRDVHNINGMLFHNQTAEAIVHREDTPKRPFVLSRAFFAGSHRFGAIWTGDNLGTWDHLAGETAMLLSNNIAGMSFCGADVGGFFGDPTPELLVRWYQAGAFMPFFRAHAHIDTKRREPYLFDEPIRGYLRDAVRLRYQMMPVWYNAFHDASIGGYPIMRPQYAVFPGDEKGYEMGDQYYVGDSGLLFKPVVTEGATSTEVYLSDDQPYYDYFSPKMYPRSTSSRTISIDTPLSSFPLLLQGGHILPIRQRVRRSSPLMWQDPFTLIIALNKEGTAGGKLYLDDGEGYGYTKGAYVYRQFEFTGSSLRSTSQLSQPIVQTQTQTQTTETGIETYDPSGNSWAQAISHVKIERIVITGLKSEPRSIKVEDKLELEYSYEKGVSSDSKKGGMASRLVIKNPGVGVVENWEITLA